MSALIAALLATLLACTPAEVAPEIPPPPDRPLLLARVAPDRIELAPSSRPERPDPEIPCGDFKSSESKDGYDEHKLSLPIRAWRAKAPPSRLVVRDADGETIPWSKEEDEVPSWMLRGATLTMRTAPGVSPAGCTITHPGAAEREETLHREWFEGTDEEFLVRSLEMDRITRTGLFMPAPSRATWTFTVPDSDRARLGIQGRVLDPHLGTGERSDGVLLQVRVTANGETTLAGEMSLDRWDWKPLRVMLTQWAGQQIEVEIATDPDGNNLYDYAFLIEPVVYVPEADPKEVVFLFLDTLRPDHMGLYGYPRNTTPAIDEWAKDAAVFENARSVAPWTLPSTRALLTGDRPETWGTQKHLAEILAEAGFATGAVVSNVNLGRFYEMDRGWEMYHHERLPSAVEIIDKGIEFLAQHQDRDTAVMLHFMEAHLPYEEPEAYRKIWAGTHYEGLPQRFGRVQLMLARPPEEDVEDYRQYIRDRYDQNIRFLNDQLARILAALPPDATVVIFSDHGEEFWDHGEVEHGHSLYDEVVRTALIIKDPDIPAGRHPEPVSITDIAPTVLDLLEIPFEERAGSSLMPLIRETEGASESLWQRPQAFSYLIWDEDAWGTLKDGKKWVTQGARTSLFDVQLDPDELNDRIDGADTAPLQAALAEATGRAVLPVWRISISSGNKKLPGDVLLTHPAGFQTAWSGYDPRVERPNTATIEGDTLRVSAPGRPPRAIFVVPNSTDPAGLQLSIDGHEGEAEPGEAPTFTRLAEDGYFLIEVAPDTVPEQVIEDYEAPTPEVEAELRALGYVE